MNKEIHDIFADILGIDDDFDDDVLFIELGGHSMLMGILQSEIQHKYGVTVPFEEIFGSGSVNGMVKYITGHKDNMIYGYGDIEFNPEPEKRYEKFPLTGIQTAYYVGRQSDTELGGNPTRGYSEIICRDYDHNRMENAINRLMTAHDVFRLVYNDDLTQQVLETNEYYVLPDEDISQLSEEEKKAHIEEKRERIFNTLFDITKLPLVHFEATKISPTEAILHFSHDGLIIDGWSHEKLIHDLDVLYADPDAELKAPKVLFRDYVNYIELLKKTDKYKADREYWLNTGYDKYEKPALPLKCDPSEVKEVNSRQVIRYIDEAVWKGVKKYASEKGITPFSLLITAFGKTILKYSSNNNFLISIPSSIRPDICDNIDDLLGECSSFFISGFNNRKDQSILDNAYDNQKNIFEIMQHNTFMGPDYIRELQKTNGANIVAPIVFTSIIDTPERSNTYLTKVYTKTHTSQIWIDAIAMKNGNSIMLLMDCTAQMFSESVTDGIGDTFVRMLEMYAANDPYIEENSYAPLLSRELEILADSTTGRLDGSVPDLSDLLMQAYSDNKERPAVICNDVITTYEQFYQEAMSTAKEIRRVTGLESRFAVGLFMDKCKYQPIASIAATLINCPFMPMDIQYSIDDVNYCAKNADIKVIITNDMFYDKLAGNVDCKVINIDKLSFTYDNDIQFEKADPTDSAFIINTSGTTGKPKSVDLKRDGLVNCVVETTKRFGLTNDDRFFNITNYCHDMAVYDIFGAFTTGGAMVIPDSDKQKEPAHWLYLISKYNVTFWNSVPSFHEMLVESEIENTADSLDSIRHILSGGESMKISLARKIRQNYRNAEIDNVGGPAEATIWSIWHRVTDSDLDRELIPYGKPLKNIRYYVLSDMMSLCPPGVEGTIFIAGIGVSKGYLGLEEATKKNFVEFDGVRVYNTGDRGLYLEDGSIRFLGRRDRQVKINGKRIELEGIAQKLSEFEGVADSEVILSERIHGLVGFITGDADIDTKAMLKELRTMLPEYMIPAEIIRIDVIPLTRNGKTDVPALERIYSDIKADQNESTVEYVSEYETEVAGICGDIIGLDNVAPDVNFYELGGNSISAIKLIAAIRSKYGVSLTIYDILNNPYVREWCRIIEDKIGTESGSDKHNENEISINDVPEEMPLSKVQEGIWFEVKSSEIASSTNIFILCGSVTLKTDDFNEKCFINAVNRLIRSNSVLRSQILERDGIPYQRFNRHEDYIPEIGEYDTGHDTVAEMLETDTIRNRIALNSYPLFVIRAGKCSDGLTVITIGIHHIISDTLTIAEMVSELDKYYSAELRGDTGNDPDENRLLKYTDYLTWQTEMLKGDHYNDDVAYWKKKLVDIPILDFAENSDHWSVFEVEKKVLDLNSEEMAQFKEICKKHYNTAANGVAAIMNIALRYYFCVDRIVFGMAYSARNSAEIEKMMGCLAVATVIDTIVTSSDTFLDVLDKTKSSINEIVAHSSLPFNTFVEKAGASRNYLMLPYNICLNCVDIDTSDCDNFSDIRFATPEVPLKFSLVAEFSRVKSAMTVCYLSSKIDAEFVDEFCQVVQDIVRAVLANENIKVDEIENMLGAE